MRIFEVEYWSSILQQNKDTITQKGWKPPFIFILLVCCAAANTLETMWTKTIFVPCILAFNSILNAHIER